MTSVALRPPGSARTEWLSERRVRAGRLAALRRAVPLVPLVLALAVYLAALSRLDPRPTADEPHYLLAASSIVDDLDVDLRDEYADPEVVGRFYDGPTLDQHAYEYRPDGRWTSVHGVGLPLLLAPVLALGGGLTAARVLLVVLAALLASQLFALLRELDLDVPRPLVWLAWAAAVFALPLVVVAGQVYPEVPAALALVVACRVVLRTDPSRRQLALAGAAAAALPWLHVRYLVLSAGIAAALAARLVLRARASGGVALRFGERGRWDGVLASPALPVALPLAVSGIVLAGLFVRWYGSPLPDAPYRPRADIPFFNQLRPAWSLSSTYRYGLGAVLSPSVGWLPFAPVHWLGLAGLVPLARRVRAPGLVLLGTGVAYVAVLGGLNPDRNLPGRLVAPLVPLVAVPLLALLWRSRVAAVLSVAGLGITAALAWSALASFPTLHGEHSGRTTVPLARTLSLVWPSTSDPEVPFFADGRPPAGPDVLARTVAPDLSPARYAARVALSTSDSGGPDDAVARIEALAGQQVLAERIVLRRDLGEDLSVVALPFAVDERASVAVQVLDEGDDVEVGLVTVAVASDPALPDDVQTRFPAWPLAAAWLGGAAVVGALADEGHDGGWAA